MVDERQTRLARIPPTWALRLPVTAAATAPDGTTTAIGPGHVELEVVRATTIGDLRAAARAVARDAAAAAVEEARAAGGSVQSLPSWAICGVEGTIPITIGRGSESGAVETLGEQEHDGTPLVNVTWLKGGGAGSAADLRVAAAACELDRRVSRLRDANEEVGASACLPACLPACLRYCSAEPLSISALCVALRAIIVPCPMVMTAMGRISSC